MSKAKDLSNVPTNPSGFRNRIINGAFDVWQRGTSFSAAGFTADRWLIQTDGSGATRAITQQTFTPGNAITGYESIYHLRYSQSVAGTGATFNILDQRIEDVRTLAGQTVTVSFWAKAAANTTIDSSIQQSFGSGGSSEVAGLSSGTLTVTTSWQRFTYTGTLASISGKTVGANSYAAFRINFPLNATFTVDIWGVQVERGSIPNPFEQRPIGMELALCQRYFINIVEPSATTDFNIPLVRESATQGVATIFLPVTMRVRPSLVGSNIGRVVMRDTSFGTSVTSVSGITVSTSGPSLSCITLIIGHGSIGGGAVFAEWDILNTTTNLSFSAEL